MTDMDRTDRALSVVHLEDNPLDAQLVRRELTSGMPQCQWRHVSGEEQYRRELEHRPPDLILADYNLPDFDGLSALAIARELCPDTPFIFVSGALGEEVAIETLKSGATDYVLKDRLRRLVPAVRRALAEAREREERQRLEEELTEISNREQRRIGSDLHDGLGQELTGLSLLLRSVELEAERLAPQLAPQVGRAREVLAQAIDSTRKLARGLAPVNLERGGLPAALEHLANRFTTPELRCEFRGDVRGFPPLNETQVAHLYRIAQEAMTNAARHAQARTIIISLTGRPDSFLLEVRDDGQGLPENLPGRSPGVGMGLRLMQYRARMIGADLAIRRARPSGVIVSVERVKGIEPSF